MQNFGLIRRGTGTAILEPIALPKLQDDYILVRTVAIALNPTDWTTLEAVGTDGTLVGCDYAGVVEEVGRAVGKPFKKGDRVAGFGHGGNDANPETGAFARSIAVKGDLQLRMPDGVSFEAACTVAVGVATTGYALYKVLGLPLPDTDLCSTDRTILIYGGSTATGTIAIQFSKLSGLKVITTCSPKHFELMKELGADVVLDYHHPNVGDQIRAATHDCLTTVFDTVSTEPTAAICAAAFGANGGVYCNLIGTDCPRTDVKSIFFLGYSITGESYIFEGEKYEARPEDFEFGVEFLKVAEKLWADVRWRPHPQRVGRGGLHGALEGMREMKAGMVSGIKLVYRVDETEWP